MKNSIIRVQKNKDNPYVMINKECIKDDNLTWAAKGLHTYLLSLPDNWTIYVNELVKHTSAGRDHTYTVIRELIKFGYMQRFEYRYKGQVISSEYIVYETAIEVDESRLTKKMATIIKVEKDSEGNYIPFDENVEKTTLEPNTDYTDLDKTDSINTKLLNNNNNNKLSKLNNDKVDVDVTAKNETKVINLYKTFKLEKKVMPHTTRLLKQYAEFISLDVFEYIFIQAREDSVAKKYNYIKTMLETFYDNKVFNMNELVKYNQKFKESKKDTKSKNISKQVKTRFHNITDRTQNYTAEELENLLKENQAAKFAKEKTKEVEFKEDTHDTVEITIELVQTCIENVNYFNSLDKNEKYAVRDYISNKGGFMPLHIRNIK